MTALPRSSRYYIVSQTHCTLVPPTLTHGFDSLPFPILLILHASFSVASNMPCGFLHFILLLPTVHPSANTRIPLDAFSDTTSGAPEPTHEHTPRQTPFSHFVNKLDHFLDPIDEAVSLIEGDTGPYTRGSPSPNTHQNQYKNNRFRALSLCLVCYQA